MYAENIYQQLFGVHPLMFSVTVRGLCEASQLTPNLLPYYFGNNKNGIHKAKTMRLNRSSSKVIGVWTFYNKCHFLFANSRRMDFLCLKSPEEGKSWAKFLL